MYNIYIWRMRMSQNLDFFAMIFSEFFLALSLSFYSALFVCTFFLTAVKKVGFKLWVKPGNGSLIN